MTKLRLAVRRIVFPTLFAVLCTGLPLAANAGEQLIESFSGPRKFAPLWPGGTVDQGGGSGLPWIRVVTDGQGGGAFVTNVRSYKPAIDMTDKFVKVWVKVDDAMNIGGMEFRLSSDRFAKDYFAFGFPTFDDEDFNVVRDGVWTVLTFSFGSAQVEGKPDRSNINAIGWYVADKGGDTPITAHWGGLASVDEPSEGVLSITFDDGYDEHLLAAQMMKRHGMRGTAYIIPDSIGELGYLTLHQLVELQEIYDWDVAAHHAIPFTDMRPDELENTILSVQRYLADNEFPLGAGHLAYPLGKQNTSLVRPLVRKHFTTARVAGSGPETLPVADRHLLRVFNVTDKTTPEEVGAIAKRAKENKEWLILMLHFLVEETQFDTEYTVANFGKLLQEIDKTGIRVLPLSEVWDACGESTNVTVASGCNLSTAVASPSKN